MYVGVKIGTGALATLGAIIAFGFGGLAFLMAILIPKSTGSYTALIELISCVIGCYAFGTWM